jgi:hypothetical protein
VLEGTTPKGKGWGKEGQVQTIIASELYIDYGLFSGLAVQSEITELLDLLYESLAWAFLTKQENP